MINSIFNLYLQSSLNIKLFKTVVSSFLMKIILKNLDKLWILYQSAEPLLKYHKLVKHL